MDNGTWEPVDALTSIQRFGFGRDVHAENTTLGLILIRSYGRSKWGQTKWYVMLPYERNGHKSNRRVTMFKTFDMEQALAYLNDAATAKRIVRMLAKRKAELQAAGLLPAKTESEAK